MRRKLWAAADLVKQGTGPAAGALWLALTVASACAGAPKSARRPDPYGSRVAGCIDAPRALNDAAQARMLRVAAGPAVQGSLPRERARARLDFGAGADARLFEDETPVRRAYVDAFSLDPSPVTHELFAEFSTACGALPPDAETVTAERWEQQRQRFGLRPEYAQIQHFLWIGGGFAKERARHPVVLVTHDDASFYCAWRGGRLPTEQEWERAARGPTGSVYPWGSRYDPFRVNTAQRGKGDTMRGRQSAAGQQRPRDSRTWAGTCSSGRPRPGPAGAAMPSSKAMAGTAAAASAVAPRGVARPTEAQRRHARLPLRGGKVNAMKLLAFDTSSAITAVAVADAVRVLSEDDSAEGDRHGEVLLPRIEAQLRAAGVALAADRFDRASGSGPVRSPGCAWASRPPRGSRSRPRFRCAA